MQTPENIYIRPRKDIDGMAFGEFIANELSYCHEDEPKLANYVEYIRSDIAEKMAKETLSQLDSPLTALLSNTEYRQYVKEFINSRKK